MKKIKKIKVSTGIYWIEIEEINFYMLCSSPADSVKYLMKKGLIVSIEDENLTYENGPNAILLSDIMIQNGSFSNLAEFPVLQMLYRQGMMLPNHPNNTGQKPLLIGSQEQIDAQMKYIYRGNYGLTSLEELVDSGVSLERAKTLMELKLKFAFGKIRKSDDLLDSVVIKNQKTQIKEELFITRDDLNKFTIFFKDEQCSVDLNLPINENYAPPYPLGFHNIKREYFGVIHSGEGDGWDINRPCVSSILMHQGKIYLIDAGPNINYVLNALGIGVDEIEGLFHTHSHDDHFAGLTTLMRSDHKIKYFASTLVRNSVSKKVAALLSIRTEQFSDFFEVHDLKLDSWNIIDGLEIQPILSPHPVETNILLFRCMGANGYKTYAHFADIVSATVLKGMVDTQFYDDILNSYLTKVDLKKIDIGGGLIHGNALDFKYDHSSKIILAHTALPLNDVQKSIGSEAPFGTVDTLIPSYRNYNFARATRLLISYFKTIESKNLELLLNNKIVLFNPGEIIIKENEDIPYLYLMLYGNASQIYSTDDSNYITIPTSSGFLGDASALEGNISTKTYRAESFITALKIPVSTLKYFIEQQNLEEYYKNLASNLKMLQKTPLFQAEIASNILNEIAYEITEVVFEAQTVIPLNDFSNQLMIIKEGKVDITIAYHQVEQLKRGDFINENLAIFDKPSVSKIVTKQTTTFYCINAKRVKDIPIVSWKILEVNLKRYAKIIQLIQKNNFNKELHLHDVNKDGKNLLDAVVILSFIFKETEKNDEILNALKNLLQVAQLNFNDQESQMIMYKYDYYKIHRKEHKEFLRIINNTIDELEHQNSIDDNNIKIIGEWTKEHILNNDKNYVEFLNKYGIYQ